MSSLDFEEFAKIFELAKESEPRERFGLMEPFIKDISHSVKRSVFPSIQDFDWDDINSDFMLQFYTICWHDAYFEYEPEQFFKFIKEMVLNSAKTFLLELNRRYNEHIDIDENCVYDDSFDIEKRIDAEKFEIENCLLDVFNSLIGEKNINDKFKKAVERYSRIIAERRVSKIY